MPLAVLVLKVIRLGLGGKNINDNILQNKRANYGKEIIATLSQQLQKKYGKGYSKRNLADMIKFSQIFYDFSILQTLSAKFTWTHFKIIIYIEDRLKREFYIKRRVKNLLLE